MDERLFIDPTIYQQLEKQTDRGAAVIGASLVEFYLERLLTSRMRTLSNKRWEYLFEGFGPLAGFASKIEIAFALNTFGEQTRTELLAINWIRNKLAHEIVGFGEWSFSHPEIAAKCGEFKLIETHGFAIFPGMEVPDTFTARGKFVATVTLLSNGLDGETVVNKHPLVSPMFLQR